MLSLKQAYAYRIGPYRLGSTLGVGTFGKVKLALHEMTQQKVAVKIINKSKMISMDMDDKLKREIRILQSLPHHPHVVRLYELIDTPTDIFMIMEYVSGGELFDYIVQKSRLSEPEARRFFQQIISGVEYCHLHLVCHRDLKPENVLLDSNGNVKVGDFGLSNFLRDGDFLKTSCGSPNYASPEVVSGKCYSGPEVDVWSCGVILYALLCGTLPFDDEHVPNLFKKIKHGNFTLPGHLSEQSRNLIVRMLVVDPSRRICIRDIRRHQWFRHSLPTYLAIPNFVDSARRPNFRFSDSPVVDLDDEILDELHQLGYVPSEIQQISGVLLPATDTPRCSVAYHLLRDKKIRNNQSHTPSQTPPCQLKSAPDSCGTLSTTDTQTHVPYWSLPSAFPRDIQKRTAAASVFQSDISPNGITCPFRPLPPAPRVIQPFNRSNTTRPTEDPQPPSDQSIARWDSTTSAWFSGRWKLGIESLFDCPAIVTTILSSLRSLDFEWSFLHPFKIRCRRLRQAVGTVTTSSVGVTRYVPKSDLTLVIQVFKVATYRYIVDVQIYDGAILASVAEALWVTSMVYSALAKLHVQSPQGGVPTWSPTTPVSPLKGSIPTERVFR